MALVRRVAAIDGTGKVITLEEPVPLLKDGEALVKVHASLISPGTEMGMVRRIREAPDPKAEPRRFGYAAAGEIVEVRGVSTLKPGMRVAAMGAGHAQHATYDRVPVNLCRTIPDGVTFEEATYACLAATALQSVRRTQPHLGEYGAVLGLGIVGNCAAQLAQLEGARVIAWERLAPRIAIAEACGISTVANLSENDAGQVTRAFAAPYGLDFAIFAFGGDGDGAFQSVQACMKSSPDGHLMGRIVLVGACHFTLRSTAILGNIDIRRSSRTGAGYHDPAYEHGADYPAGFVQFTTQRNLHEILQLIAEKRLRVTPMTTHCVPLEEVGDVADLLLTSPQDALGVVLTMGDQ